MTRHHAGVLADTAQTHVMAGPAAAAVVSLPFGIARRTLIASFQQLLLWQDRASQRHHLSMAEDAMLSDIGLTRAEVALEIKKPFWRP